VRKTFHPYRNGTEYIGGQGTQLTKNPFSGGSFNSLEQYRRVFGNFYPAINDYQVPASWQSAIGLGGTLGNFIGIPWGAFLVERLGYRKTLLINYVIIVPFIGESGFPNLFVPCLYTVFFFSISFSHLNL